MKAGENTQPAVAIDCFAEGPLPYGEGYAVVVVDVIRATTTAITAAASGRRCYPVPSLDAARALARELENPLLAGELGGIMPLGFEMNNSPADLVVRTDERRPMILLSSSGTRLMEESRRADAAVLACFRNAKAVAPHLAGRYPQVALIGAATRGDFREEDQICCSWIARDLVERGYRPANRKTAELIKTWATATAEDCLVSESAAYLRRSRQLRDLQFVLSHVNDLDDAFLIHAGEVVAARFLEHPRAAAATAREGAA